MDSNGSFSHPMFGDSEIAKIFNDFIHFIKILDGIKGKDVLNLLDRATPSSSATSGVPNPNDLHSAVAPSLARDARNSPIEAKNKSLVRGLASSRGEHFQPISARFERNSMKFIREDLHSVFIDNLPPLIHCSDLRNLFKCCGLVVDSFIPVKRRIISGSKFGFVRFRLRSEANKAIQFFKNDVWFGYRIDISMATSRPRIEPQKFLKPPVMVRKKKDLIPSFVSGYDLSQVSGCSSVPLDGAGCSLLPEPYCGRENLGDYRSLLLSSNKSGQIPNVDGSDLISNLSMDGSKVIKPDGSDFENRAVDENCDLAPVSSIQCASAPCEINQTRQASVGSNEFKSIVDFLPKFKGVRDAEFYKMVLDNLILEEKLAKHRAKRLRVPLSNFLKLLVVLAYGS